MEGFVTIMFMFLAALAILVQVVLWKKEQLTAFAVFHGTYTLYYIVVPFLLLALKNNLENSAHSFVRGVYNSSNEELIYGFFIIFLGYITLLTVYFAVGSRMKKLSLNHDDNTIRKHIPITYKFSWVTIVIGTISFILFFRELGGFGLAISLSAEIRSYLTSNERYYSALGAIFKLLSFLILSSSYGFFILHQIRKEKKSKVLFYISFSISIMYLLFNAGRATLLFYIFPFIIQYVERKNKNVLLTLLGLFVATIIGASLFDTLFYRMTIGNSSVLLHENSFSLIESLLDVLQDLAFPFNNVLSSSGMNQSFGLRLGIDYFLWIIDILPSRLFGMIGLDILSYNTINSLTSTYMIGNLNLRGGVPTDILTLGMRQLPLIGVVINILVYTMLSLFIDKLTKEQIKFTNIAAIRVKMLMFTVVANNDLASIIKGSLYVIVLIILLLRYRKVIRFNKKITKISISK